MKKKIKKGLLAVLLAWSMLTSQALPSFASEFSDGDPQIPSEDFGTEMSDFESTASGSSSESGNIWAESASGSDSTWTQSSSESEENVAEESLYESVEEATVSEEKALGETSGALQENMAGEQPGDFAEGEAEGDFAAAEDTAESSGIRYIKGRPLTEEEIARQKEMEILTGGMVMPDETELAPESRSVSYLMAFAAAQPDKYDAREKNLVTPVKNQNQGTSLGICWAFTMASLMETSLLKKGYGTYDLSEEHLAYFLYNHVDDPLGNTPNDHTYQIKNGVINSKEGYHNGGNGHMAINHLATWSGMTTEADVPLPGRSPAAVPEDAKAYHVAAHLRNAYRSAYTVARAKSLISTYGSAGVHVYYASNYYNYDTAAYAYPEKHAINHMVTLVGWDDTYSKDNFSSSSGVSADGAWIAKNSWGTGWGDEGYFYISYQDPTLAALVTTDAAVETSYPNNYFYDGSALDVSVSLQPGESVANVYTVKTDGAHTEVLGEAGVYINSENSKYTIQVFTNLKDPSDPSSGTLAASQSNIFQSYGGIRTWNLPEVTLLPGTSFAIVLTNAADSGVLKVQAEADVDQLDEAKLSGIRSEADIKSGQSFYSAGSLTNWQDLANGTVCADAKSIRGVPVCMRLKAHTRTTQELPAMALSAEKEECKVGASVDVNISMAPQTAGGDWYMVSSDHPEIASAVMSGENGIRITGNAPGTAVITCQSRLMPSLTRTMSVEVSFAATSCSVKAASSGYNTVSWKQIPGAAGYYVYRRPVGGGWSRIGTVTKSTVVSYQDKKAKTLTAYEYCVRAYRSVNGKTVKSAYTVSKKVITAPAKQKIKKLTSVSNGIKITWTAQKKASGYRVYRKKKNGKWVLLKEITKGTTASYTDKKAKKKVTYYYAVRAFVKEPDGSKLPGLYTAKSGKRT